MSVFSRQCRNTTVRLLREKRGGRPSVSTPSSSAWRLYSFLSAENAEDGEGKIPREEVQRGEEALLRARNFSLSKNPNPPHQRTSRSTRPSSFSSSSSSSSSRSSSSSCLTGRRLCSGLSSHTGRISPPLSSSSSFFSPCLSLLPSDSPSFHRRSCVSSSIDPRKGKEVRHERRRLWCTYSSERHCSMIYPSSRKLSDVVKLPLLRLKPPSEIARMWQEYFDQEHPLVSTASIHGSLFESLSANSAVAPHFVLPLPRTSSSSSSSLSTKKERSGKEREGEGEGGGGRSFEMFYLQFLNPKTCLITSLHEYQTRHSLQKHPQHRHDGTGGGASPFLAVTFYDEMLKEKDLVLVKADVLRGEVLKKDEAAHLLSLLLMFYGDPNLSRWVLDFNLKPRDFSFHDFCQEGGLQAFFHFPLQKSISIVKEDITSH